MRSSPPRQYFADAVRAVAHAGAPDLSLSPLFAPAPQRASAARFKPMPKPVLIAAPRPDRAGANGHPIFQHFVGTAMNEP